MKRRMIKTWVRSGKSHPRLERIPMTELLPGDVLLSAEEFERVREALKSEERRCGRLFGELNKALELLDAAKGRKL